MNIVSVPAGSFDFLGLGVDYEMGGMAVAGGGCSLVSKQIWAIPPLFRGQREEAFAFLGGGYFDRNTLG